ncbi:dimethyladenosine transferase [Propionigenium maris DSM 9537]|uniref:Dimethyladenosine transferase n=1 Tax=Propionigenium maris DSM 9537 TaxID=1123000 RepID=A0A9W6GPP5_9FUSO|nr:DJ-1/PfpI family protein [Propionigenium maris]GLI57945.1 dimethyladenosine transferase [Propionigenium maris DSM 9537]
MKKVLLLLANGYEVLEASVFIDVIGWNYIDGDKTTKLYTCGVTKEVNTTFDQKTTVDYTIDEVDFEDYDALAIPGGFAEYDFYSDGYSEKFLNVIREFDKRRKIIASICVAALTIGRSGVLRGRNATTYNRKERIRQRELAEYGVKVMDQPIVIDDNIITSYNPSTAFDVAFTLLELLTSKENTDDVKRLMGFIE